MIRVFLADDEPFTIRMLRNLLDWEALGMEIAGTALNGQEAYECIRRDRPELVLTDIRMPRMDGLELVKRVSRENDRIKFIIMSAYADVEYLREAMKLGCCDYIIKPIDEYELEETLRRVARRIQGEHEKERQISRSNEQLEQISLYHYMTTGQGWRQKTLPAFAAWLNRSAWSVFLFCAENASIDEYVNASQMEFIRTGYLSGLLREVLRECSEHQLFFDYEEGVWIAVLELETAEQKTQAARRVLVRMEEETSLHLKACFSLTGHSQEELPQLYEDTAALAKYGFYVGDVQILGHGYNCNKAEFDEVCRIGRQKEQAQTAGEAEAAGRRTELPRMRPDDLQAHYSRPVTQSLAMLEARYNENLSLDEICEAVSVSKNYFCYLFKREVGMSVWNCLTRIRVEHAKRLLETTDLKSYEIAFAVGYDNPSYFSKLFKKNEAVSPNEYREMMQRERRGDE